MSLPYENATSGKDALNEIARTLEAFGASSFGSMEDFAQGDLIIQFEYRGRRITARANAKGYAATWLRRNPWNSRRRITQREYEERALRQGRVAVYSILRDLIRAQITAVETGLLTFEAAFLGQIMLPGGETIYERVMSEPGRIGLPGLEGGRASREAGNDP